MPNNAPSIRTGLSRSVTLAFVAIALVLSVSCKKSNSTSNSYYMKATIDGTAMNFNVNDIALSENLAGTYMLSASGSLKSGSLEGIAINITSGTKAIVAGTYSDTTSSPDYAVVAVYNPNSTTITWGSGLYADANTKPLIVKITQLDSKTIKGTFSGDLYYTNTTTAQMGPDKKTVTDGEFFMHF